ncbi:LytR C-terminal domain-containing protein [Iamia sp. SCSIO 61187]|uniref:LytR C-terminal domain-containing protein n=1 Tax=Iamia sp. SCSIO 61187 TaxID=2722752 RepID=UPI001C62BE6A|nr:LytR C-terminal domain-containing protein [Iamia sp. SCSIO 61187]QYG92881.1 LytR C-terminal domain-containing protein [Iamia sp. SCSIO 61187]
MGDDDQTVRFLRDELDLPAPAAEPAPPPPPPGPSAPVGPPRARRRGGGVLWLGLVLAVVLAFVAGTYLLVDRVERDRPRGGSVVPTTAAGPPTTAPTTTAAPPVTQDPASVSVVVLNGTPQRGWAADNGDRLDEAGYETERSDALTDTVETTTVYVALPELEPDAASIADLLGFPDAPVEARPAEPLGEAPAAAEADIVVVLGADSLP